MHRHHLILHPALETTMNFKAGFNLEGVTSARQKITFAEMLQQSVTFALLW